MKLIKLIASLAIVFAVGGVGSLATLPNLSSWYTTLEKAPLTPPNAVFGPVWTILYILIAISLYLVWSSNRRVKRIVYYSFALQLTLNALWSIAFFGMHQLRLAIVIIFLLLAAVIWNIGLTRDVSKPASYLLIPYAAWISFATYLTVGFAVLNL